MRLLLDTHAFLWFILDDPQLSDKARTLIADGHNDVLVSPTTYWEIAIKISIGKYALPEPYDVFMQRELASNAFAILPILPTHTADGDALPSSRSVRPIADRAGDDRDGSADQRRCSLRRLSREETLVATFVLPTSASPLCSTVNDGVKVRYGKFGDLLAEVKEGTGNK